MKIQTVQNKVSKKQIIKKSTFLALVFPVNKKDEIKEILRSIKQTYKEADHIPYAYRIAIQEEHNIHIEEHCSDDGEPTNTAGKPILTQLQTHNVVNLCVAVIRVFGGIKLGPSGLIKAFSSTTKLALEQEENIISTTLTKTYSFTTTIQSFSIFETYLKQNKLHFETNFSNTNIMIICALPYDKAEKYITEIEQLKIKTTLENKASVSKK